VFSNDAQLRNTLGLYWGVQVMPYEPDLNLTIDQTVEGIKQTLVSQKRLASGDIFINTLSMPLTQARRTNTVKLSTVD